MEYRIEHHDGLTDIRFENAGAPAHVPVEVREAIKGIGFCWDGEVWRNWCGCDDKEIRSAIASVIRRVRPSMVSKEAQKALKEEYLRYVDQRWLKDSEKRIGVLVKLTDGRIVNLEKPRIETDFCFGESGYDYDKATHMASVASSDESYFLARNLHDIAEKIAICGYGRNNMFSVDGYVWEEISNVNDHIAWVWIGNYGRHERVSEVSEEDRERMYEGYVKLYEDFEKRLRTYLKRYGLSKVHSWTYWRDA